MFCHITQNWRGRPLVSHEVIIQLIANTTTQSGVENPLNWTQPAIQQERWSATSNWLH